MSHPYPKSWNWSAERHPKRLAEWSMAPDEFGFYEIGSFNGRFEAMYGGRASGKTIRQRLREHYYHSHNESIRRHRDDVWFRFKVLRSVAEARFVEAVHIAALAYPWNNRNEWSSHWVLED
jgi:hypothetical protein